MMRELTETQREWADYLIMEEIPLTAKCDIVEMVAHIEDEVATISDADCKELLTLALA